MKALSVSIRTSWGVGQVQVMEVKPAFGDNCLVGGLEGKVLIVKRVWEPSLVILVMVVVGVSHRQ